MAVEAVRRRHLRICNGEREASTKPQKKSSEIMHYWQFWWSSTDPTRWMHLEHTSMAPSIAVIQAISGWILDLIISACCWTDCFCSCVNAPFAIIISICCNAFVAWMLILNCARCRSNEDSAMVRHSFGSGNSNFSMISFRYDGISVRDICANSSVWMSRWWGRSLIFFISTAPVCGDTVGNSSDGS